MAEPTPRIAAAQRELLDGLVEEFLHNYRTGRTFVAVDGIVGAGMATFADALATRMMRAGHSVFRASIDNFHRPREARYLRGADSPEGFYRDSYDYDLFRRVLVEPFRMGGSAGFVTAAFDLGRDSQIEMDWKTGPRDATLVVDGIFLNRPELRALWNYSIWLDVDRRTADARPHVRDGRAGGPRYEGGQELYMSEAEPRARATAIVDNSNPEFPYRVFADSC
jgi:uridine kinase